MHMHNMPSVSATSTTIPPCLAAVTDFACLKQVALEHVGMTCHSGSAGHMHPLPVDSAEGWEPFLQLPGVLWQHLCMDQPLLWGNVVEAKIQKT
jgi:hypothetical protein